MNHTRITARAATSAAVLFGALALTAAPAFAHVEVTSDTAQALATDATLAFTAEAESTTAGVTSLRVVLSTGIAPGDVTLAQGPDGWTLSPADDGYTLAGPAVAPGKDVAYKVTVRQLPDAQELAFKTLQTYSDGRVDRWIELPKDGTEPDKPAPLLKLKAAAPGATPIAAAPTAAASAPVAVSPTGSASASAAQPSATPSTPMPAPTAAATSEKDSASTVTGVVGAVVVLVLAAGGFLWWRRRSTSSS